MSNRLREYREKLGLSQVQLARKVKMASPNLCNLEKGRLMPWERIKSKLARALKTTPQELFPEQEP